MEQLCRTCLSPGDGGDSIFTIKLVDAEYIAVSKMISTCIGIEISPFDTISSVICETCVDFIIVAYKYRKQCWKSNTILLEQSREEYEKTREEARLQKEIQRCEQTNREIEHQQQELSNVLKNEISDNESNWLGMDESSLDFENEFIPYSVVEQRKKPKKKKQKSRLKYDENGIPMGYSDMTEHCELVKDEKSDSLGLPQMYKCKLCGFTYQRIGPLRLHLQKVHNMQFNNNFKCDICGKLFVAQRLLKFHVKTHRENQFVCQYCGKDFRLNSALAVHVRRHLGDKPYKCDQCEFRTITKSDLDTHKRSHTGVKPFKCYHCNAAFSTFSHRASHVRQHSEERPYKCMICMTSYKQRGVYKSHMDSHDPKKSIVCEVCKHICSNRKNYMRHIKQHSKTTVKS